MMASPNGDTLTDHTQENGYENAELAEGADLKTMIQNTNSNHSPVNGIANHINHDFKTPSSSSKHSSSSENKERSKDSKHSSSSSKHKEGSSSSSSKHRDGSSSSSSRHKDGSSSSSKHRDSSSSSSKNRDKDRSSSSSSSKHSSSSGSHSSSSKSKDGSSSSSSKHREGSSSSSSKSKDGSSSSSHSKDKSSSSSSSKHSDKPKSSSSSDKHRSSSSSKSSSSSSDKHRSKDSSSSKREKESSSSSSKSTHDGAKGDAKMKNDVKSSSSKSTSEGIKEEKDVGSPKEEKPIKVKEEPASPTKAPLGSPKKEQSPSKSPVKEVKSPVKMEVKEEPESDDEDEKPLSLRIPETTPGKAIKREREESTEEDEKPLVPQKAKKIKTEGKAKKRKIKQEEEEEEEAAPAKKAKKGKKVKEENGANAGKVKKEKDEPEVWRWWEEEKRDDGVKWTFLEHKGPVFAPAYEPLPKDIKFYYDGKVMRLEPDTEEVATFYGRMLDHDYTTKEVFNANFFKDWRSVMTKAEKEKITDLAKCNFTEINEYFKVKSEQRKAMSKEEKQLLKKKNEEIVKEYGFAKIDGHVEKIGNFKIEPPGLFRGRGDHPKQGMLKKRVVPEDVIINCAKDSVIPKAPEGHKWKEVRHDNRVTWLSSWTENIQGSVKYVMLNAASKLKGEKDWQKYETARRLHKTVDKIRASYQEDWKSKEMRVRQRSVALYFIDKLALRAGNEKEEGETADTVGCCSLRVEHLTLSEEKDGKNYVVEFDFLGKDSIRYTNSVPVEKRVFKNLQLFMENKQPEDDIFDRLNTAVLNKHLQELMDGLTAKVFRTYNASHTLQEQLNLLTNPDDTVPAKILAYNRANRAVAVLCNHQRAVPKTFAKSMENLQGKIMSKKKDIKEVKKDIKDIKADYKATKTAKARTMYEKKKKMLERLEEQLVKLEVQATDKDENKDIALGTSKLNYLDPRISVAWCKKFDVPLEKIYNKTQRDKFRWAIDMATADFQF